MHRSLLSWLACVCVLAVAWVVPQTRAAAGSTADDASAEAVDPADVLPNLADLGEAADEAERALAKLADTDAETRIVEARARLHDELEGYVQGHESGALRTQRIATLRERLLVEREAIGSVLDAVTADVRAVHDIADDFGQRKADWARWRGELRGHVGAADLRDAFKSANGRIDHVLELAPETTEPLIAVQRDLVELDRAFRDLIARVDTLAEHDQSVRTRRNAPSIVDRSFWTLTNDAWSGHPRAWSLPVPFLDRVRVILVAHLVGIGALFVIARRMRRDAKEGARAIVTRPLALGVFVATALFSGLYEPMPVGWAFMIWACVAVAAIRLGTTMKSSPGAGGVPILATASYPILLLVDVLGPPEPAVRIARAVASIAVAVLAWRRAGDRSESWRARASRGAALLLPAAATAGLAGYAALARFAVDALAASAFIAASAWMIVVLLTPRDSDAVDRAPDDFWRRLARRTVRHGSMPLRAAVVIIAAFYIGYAWELLPSPVESWRAMTSAVSILGVEVNGRAIAVAIAVFLLAFEASWIVQTAIEGAARRAGAVSTSPGTIESVKRLAHYSLLGLAFLLALTIAGVELSNLAIVFGALGVGIGFGLQNIAHDVVSGLVLLSERSLRVGDTVTFDTQFGRVLRIGLRATVVELIDGTELVVPNRKLTDDPLVNWTLSASTVGLFIPVGVEYGSDLKAVFETLREAARAHDVVLDDPAPQVLFMGFGDSTLDFELRVRIARPDERFRVRSELLEAIDTRFRKRGITIAFPQRDLHVRSVDPQVVAALTGQPSATGRAE